jgi:FeS assembly SUF system regulator
VIILSRLADYGVIIATHLAGAPGHQVNAAAVAEATRLPPATVAKLLKRLAHAGIVAGTRGATGGYRLARAPEAVSIAEVVAAIDGEIGVTQCSSHVEGCERTHFCPTRPHWAHINRAVSQALGAVSLAEMVRPGFLPPHPSSEVQISA